MCVISRHAPNAGSTMVMVRVILRNADGRMICKERLHHLQNESYLLSCWVIMPRHCHAVTRPFDGHVLEDLLGATKGVSARHINSALDETGPLWEEESYDRIIRDEEHLWRVIQYTGRNRRLAGLQHKEQWRR